MSSTKKNSKELKTEMKDEIDYYKNSIKFIIRTIENNTHEVIEDTKLKNITSWRKSNKKFLKNLIFNIFSLGILHVISLFYPKLYLKLYCSPWPPKECDFFLIENIYGELTLCTKIYKKSKNNDSNFNLELSKENTISSSLSNFNNKKEFYLNKNLTYSFKYNSVTYEYNEETNEIIPVYMNISKLTNKFIFNYFGEGLYSDNLVKKYEERYGKNEYYINLFIVHLYFKNLEIKYFIFILITKAFDLLTDDQLSFFLTLAIIILILFLEYYITKKFVYDLFKKEYTLDGEKNLIKVKRKHKIDDESKFFYEIKNSDLLPGDIIYLNSNDFVPCDCLILEGDCIVNENNLNGSLNISKKTCLENNNEQFNYKLNKINILYHGMKIVKTSSKINEGYISVLCINTGPNTYKANLFSNILYVLNRKKEYSEEYKLLGQERKKFLIIILVIFFFSISLGILYMFTINVSIYVENMKSLLLQTIAKLISKCSMPTYFLTKSIIIISSLYNLKTDKIICFEKSKILHSCTVNTVFFGKTGALCENNFEINGYHPIYINPRISNKIGISTYKINQIKEMNSQLVKFYKEYLIKNKNINLNESVLRNALKFEHNQLTMNKISRESWECVTLFLECLLSCNNLEKNNMELFGNSIEKEIFENMKWDIKSYNFNSSEQDKELLDEENSYLSQINNNKYYYDENSYLIDKRIYDIYPNNYYKITESIKNEMEYQKKYNKSKFNSKKAFNRKNASNYDSESFSNFIKINISKNNNIKSYKLRIYKRFIKSGTLESSAIVYNFITKELRFMTKGIPENLLDKCDYSTLPKNIDRMISFYRRNGFIIYICATKIINLDQYSDSVSIEEYMTNLKFCGFITLNYILKKDIINSIKDLKHFNCNMIISSGDDDYNSLSVGFNSNIIDNKNKNIFSFDKDEKKNKIIIKKICNQKKSVSEENEQNYNSPSIDQISKNTSKISNRVISSPYMKLKETEDLKYNESNNNSLLQKKPTIKLKGFVLNQLNKETIRDELNKNGYYLLKENNLKKRRVSKNIRNFNDKNQENKIYPKYSPLNINSDFTDNENYQKNIEMIYKPNINNKHKKSKDKISFQKSNNSKNLKSNNTIISSSPKIEKYDYYPRIFEDHEDLVNNSIYCVSGKLINFLYKNKEKKHFKKFLELIQKNCKIFYNMTSLDKSLTIDLYRENANNNICYIGECQSDFDAIMTSNIGINLKAPNNRNTIFCHFYSEFSISSIKRIIREGRAVNENVMLLKMTSVFYTMILNSYIMCCLIRHVKIINGQLNLLEICFFIMSISAFTVKYDTFTTSNTLIQNKKLYNMHYYIQIIGMFILKLISTYYQCSFFIGNDYGLDERTNDTIYCCFYFIFCIEQLLSTIFVSNLIYFYRKNSFTNTFFILFSLIVFLYFIILLTLNSSNFRYDIFNITIFEFLDELIDSFDDSNKLRSFYGCIGDLIASIFYSRIIYFIFYKISQRNYK